MSQSIEKHRGALLVPVSAGALGGAAGVAGGGGLGAAIGFAILGPPGAAVGFLAGMALGGPAGAIGAERLQRRLNR